MEGRTAPDTHPDIPWWCGSSASWPWSSRSHRCGGTTSSHVVVPLALLVGHRARREPDPRRRRRARGADRTVVDRPSRRAHPTPGTDRSDRRRWSDGSNASRRARWPSATRRAWCGAPAAGFPDRFVDVSILRITSPTKSLRLTGADIVRAAARRDVCAVVRWSGVRFTHFPEPRRPTPRARLPRGALRCARAPRSLWVKRDCRP